MSTIETVIGLGVVVISAATGNYVFAAIIAAALAAMASD